MPDIYAGSVFGDRSELLQRFRADNPRYTEWGDKSLYSVMALNDPSLPGRVQKDGDPDYKTGSQFLQAYREGSPAAKDMDDAALGQALTAQMPELQVFGFGQGEGKVHRELAGEPVMSPFESTFRSKYPQWIGPAPKADISALPNAAVYDEVMAENAKGRAGFGEGIADNWENMVPFYGSVKAALDVGKLAITARKLQSGEDVSDQDMLDLNIYLAEQDRAANANWLGKAGSVVASSLGFMGEFAAVALGGAGLSALAARGGAEVGKTALEKLALSWAKQRVWDVAAESAEKAAQKFMTRNVGQEAMEAYTKSRVFRGVTGAAGALTRAAVGGGIQTAARSGVQLLASGTTGSAAETELYAALSDDPMSRGRAFATGLLKDFIENSTEYTGGSLLNAVWLGAPQKWQAAFAKFASDEATRLAPKLGREAAVQAANDAAKKTQQKWAMGMILSDFAKKHDINYADAVKSLVKVGYNGIIEEMSEERLGGFLHGLFGTDGSEGGLRSAIEGALPTTEEAAVELLAFSMPLAAIKATDVAQKHLAGVFGNDIVGTVAAVKKFTDPPPTFIDRADGKRDAVTDATVTAEEAATARKFFGDLAEKGQAAGAPGARLFDVAMSLVTFPLHGDPTRIMYGSLERALSAETNLNVIGAYRLIKNARIQAGATPEDAAKDARAAIEASVVPAYMKRVEIRKDLPADLQEEMKAKILPGQIEELPRLGWAVQESPNALFSDALNAELVRQGFLVARPAVDHKVIEKDAVALRSLVEEFEGLDRTTPEGQRRMLELAIRSRLVGAGQLADFTDSKFLDRLDGWYKNLKAIRQAYADPNTFEPGMQVRNGKDLYVVVSRNGDVVNVRKQGTDQLSQVSVKEFSAIDPNKPWTKVQPYVYQDRSVYYGTRAEIEKLTGTKGYNFNEIAVKLSEREDADGNVEPVYGVSFGMTNWLSSDGTIALRWRPEVGPYHMVEDMVLEPRARLLFGSVSQAPGVLPAMDRLVKALEELKARTAAQAGAESGGSRRDVAESTQGLNALLSVLSRGEGESEADYRSRVDEIFGKLVLQLEAGYDYGSYAAVENRLPYQALFSMFKLDLAPVWAGVREDFITAADKIMGTGWQGRYANPFIGLSKVTPAEVREAGSTAAGQQARKQQARALKQNQKDKEKEAAEAERAKMDPSRAAKKPAAPTPNPNLKQVKNPLGIKKQEREAEAARQAAADQDYRKHLAEQRDSQNVSPAIIGDIGEGLAGGVSERLFQQLVKGTLKPHPKSVTDNLLVQRHAATPFKSADEVRAYLNSDEYKKAEAARKAELAAQEAAVPTGEAATPSKARELLAKARKDPEAIKAREQQDDDLADLEAFMKSLPPEERASALPAEKLNAARRVDHYLRYLEQGGDERSLRWKELIEKLRKASSPDEVKDLLQELVDEEKGIQLLRIRPSALKAALQYKYRPQSRGEIMREYDRVLGELTGAERSLAESFERELDNWGAGTAEEGRENPTELSTPAAEETGESGDLDDYIQDRRFAGMLNSPALAVFTALARRFFTGPQMHLAAAAVYRKHKDLLDAAIYSEEAYRQFLDMDLKSMDEATQKELGIRSDMGLRALQAAFRAVPYMDAVQVFSKWLKPVYEKPMVRLSYTSDGSSVYSVYAPKNQHGSRLIDAIERTLVNSLTDPDRLDYLRESVDVLAGALESKSRSKIANAAVGFLQDLSDEKGDGTSAAAVWAKVSEVIQGPDEEVATAVVAALDALVKGFRTHVFEPAAAAPETWQTHWQIALNTILRGGAKQLGSANAFNARTGYPVRNPGRSAIESIIVQTNMALYAETARTPVSGSRKLGYAPESAMNGPGMFRVFEALGLTFLPPEEDLDEALKPVDADRMDVPLVERAQRTLYSWFKQSYEAALEAEKGQKFIPKVHPLYFIPYEGSKNNVDLVEIPLSVIAKQVANKDGSLPDFETAFERMSAAYEAQFALPATVKEAISRFIKRKDKDRSGGAEMVKVEGGVTSKKAFVIDTKKPIQVRSADGSVKELPAGTLFNGNEYLTPAFSQRVLRSYGFFRAHSLKATIVSRADVPVMYYDKGVKDTVAPKWVQPLVDAIGATGFDAVNDTDTIKSLERGTAKTVEVPMEDGSTVVLSGYAVEVPWEQERLTQVLDHAPVPELNAAPLPLLLYGVINVGDASDVLPRMLLNSTQAKMVGPRVELAEGLRDNMKFTRASVAALGREVSLAYPIMRSQVLPVATSEVGKVAPSAFGWQSVVKPSGGYLDANNRAYFPFGGGEFYSPASLNPDGTVQFGMARANIHEPGFRYVAMVKSGTNLGQLQAALRDMAPGTDPAAQQKARAFLSSVLRYVWDGLEVDVPAEVCFDDLFDKDGNFIESRLQFDGPAFAMYAAQAPAAVLMGAPKILSRTPDGPNAHRPVFISAPYTFETGVTGDPIPGPQNWHAMHPLTQMFAGVDHDADKDLLHGAAFIFDRDSLGYVTIKADAARPELADYANTNDIFTALVRAFERASEWDVTNAIDTSFLENIWVNYEGQWRQVKDLTKEGAIPASLKSPQDVLAKFNQFETQRRLWRVARSADALKSSIVPQYASVQLLFRHLGLFYKEPYELDFTNPRTGKPDRIEVVRPAADPTRDRVVALALANFVSFAIDDPSKPQCAYLRMSPDTVSLFLIMAAGQPFKATTHEAAKKEIADFYQRFVEFLESPEVKSLAEAREKYASGAEVYEDPATGTKLTYEAAVWASLANEQGKLPNALESLQNFEVMGRRLQNLTQGVLAIKKRPPSLPRWQAYVDAVATTGGFSVTKPGDPLLELSKMVLGRYGEAFMGPGSVYALDGVQKIAEEISNRGRAKGERSTKPYADLSMAQWAQFSFRIEQALLVDAIAAALPEDILQRLYDVAVASDSGIRETVRRISAIQSTRSEARHGALLLQKAFPAIAFAAATSSVGNEWWRQVRVAQTGGLGADVSVDFLVRQDQDLTTDRAAVLLNAFDQTGSTWADGKLTVRPVVGGEVAATFTPDEVKFLLAWYALQKDGVGSSLLQAMSPAFHQRLSTALATRLSHGFTEDYRKHLTKYVRSAKIKEYRPYALRDVRPNVGAPAAPVSKPDAFAGLLKKTVTLTPAAPVTAPPTETPTPAQTKGRTAASVVKADFIPPEPIFGFSGAQTGGDLTAARILDPVFPVYHWLGATAESIASGAWDGGHYLSPQGLNREYLLKIPQSRLLVLGTDAELLNAAGQRTFAARGGRLIARDALQVRNPAIKQVFATLPAGAFLFDQLSERSVQSGTRHAVGLALDRGIEVNVFAEGMNSWYRLVKGQRPAPVAEDQVRITAPFAAVGSRQITAKSEEALKRLADRSTSTQETLVPEKAAPAPVQEAPKAEAQAPTVNIWYGAGQNRILSNLNARPFTYEGRAYRSVEHAYQSLKTGAFNQAVWDEYQKTKSVSGLKIPGGKAKTEGGWNVQLMERLIRASLQQNVDVADALVETGSATLTHTQDQGIWKTEFPRIMMKIREELKREAAARGVPKAETPAAPAVERPTTLEDEEDLADANYAAAVEEAAQAASKPTPKVPEKEQPAVMPDVFRAKTPIGNPVVVEKVGNQWTVTPEDDEGETSLIDEKTARRFFEGRIEGKDLASQSPQNAAERAEAEELPPPPPKELVEPPPPAAPASYEVTKVIGEYERHIVSEGRGYVVRNNQEGEITYVTPKGAYSDEKSAKVMQDRFVGKTVAELDSGATSVAQPEPEKVDVEFLPSQILPDQILLGNGNLVPGTPDQMKALARFDEVASHAFGGAGRSGSTTVIMGRPGVGKTTILNEAMRRMRLRYGDSSRPLPVGLYLATPTHMASGVVGMLTTFWHKIGWAYKITRERPEVSTTASLLGARPEAPRNKRTGRPDDGYVKRGSMFYPTVETAMRMPYPPDIANARMVVIDESSMLQDGELELLKEWQAKRGVELVFLGDSAQLPPVREGGGTTGPDIGSVFRKEFKADSVVELTQVMRQGTGNPLLKVLERLRTAIFAVPAEAEKATKLPDAEAINPKTGEGYASVGSGAAAFDALKASVTVDLFRRDPLALRIYSPTNWGVRQWNERIFAHLFPKEAAAQQRIAPGAVVRAYANVSFPEELEAEAKAMQSFLKTSGYSNSDDFVVTRVGPEQKLGGPVRAAAGLVGRFVELEAAVPGDRLTGETTNRVFLVNADQGKALVAAVQSVRAQMQLAFQSKDWKRAWPLKDLVSVLSGGVVNFDTISGMGVKSDAETTDKSGLPKAMDLGYASTIHKGQGATNKIAIVDTGAVDAAKRFPLFTRLQLLYVGLSRASKAAIAVQPSTTSRWSQETVAALRGVLDAAGTDNRPPPRVENADDYGSLGEERASAYATPENQDRGDADLSALNERDRTLAEGLNGPRASALSAIWNMNYAYNGWRHLGLAEGGDRLLRELADEWGQMDAWRDRGMAEINRIHRIYGSDDGVLYELADLAELRGGKRPLFSRGRLKAVGKLDERQQLQAEMARWIPAALREFRDEHGVPVISNILKAELKPNMTDAERAALKAKIEPYLDQAMVTWGHEVRDPHAQQPVEGELDADGKPKKPVYLPDQELARTVLDRFLQSEAHAELNRAGRRDDVELDWFKDLVDLHNFYEMFPDSLKRIEGYVQHQWGVGFRDTDTRAAEKMVQRELANLAVPSTSPLLADAVLIPEAKDKSIDVSQRDLYNRLTGQAYTDKDFAEAGVTKVRDLNALIESELHKHVVRMATMKIRGETIDEELFKQELALLRKLKDLTNQYGFREWAPPMLTRRFQGSYEEIYRETLDPNGKHNPLMPATMDFLRLRQAYLTQTVAALRNRDQARKSVLQMDEDGMPSIIMIPAEGKDVLALLPKGVVAEMGLRWARAKGKAFDPTKDVRGQLIAMESDLGAAEYANYASPFPSIDRIRVRKGSTAEAALKHWIERPYQLRVHGVDLLERLVHITQWGKMLGVGHSLFFAVSVGESAVAGSGFENNILWGKDLTSTYKGRGPQVALRKMRDLAMQQAAGDPELADFMYKLGRAGIETGGEIPLDMAAGMFDRDIHGIVEAIGDAYGERAKNQARGIFHYVTGRYLSERFFGKPGVRGGLFQASKVYLTDQMARQFASEMGENWDALTDRAQIQILRRIAPFINAAYGGDNWRKYWWSTPRVVQLMNLLMFAPQWTWAAFNVAGGGLVTGGLLGNHMSADTRRLVTRNAVMMWGLVLGAIPAMLQAAVYVAARAAGGGDDDDRPFPEQNEAGRGSYIDITPALRMMPGYKGDPTGKRRVYIRFGKQAWEVYNGWLTKPLDTALGKMSVPAKIVYEQVTGMSPGSDWTLEFNGRGLAGFLSAPNRDGEKTFWKSRVGYTAQKFLPMSVMAAATSQDAGLLPLIAPVSHGKSQGGATADLTTVLNTIAEDSHWRWAQQTPGVTENLRGLGNEILEGAARNGFDTDKILTTAKSVVLGRLYKEFTAALNDNDTVAMDKVANRILRVGGTIRGLKASVKARRAGASRVPTQEELDAIDAAMSGK